MKDKYRELRYDLALELGQAFKRRRVKDGIRLQTLARKFGCSRQHLSHVEQGNQVCSFQIIEKLFNYYKDVALEYEISSIFNKFYTESLRLARSDKS